MMKRLYYLTLFLCFTAFSLSAQLTSLTPNGDNLLIEDLNIQEFLNSAIFTDTEDVITSGLNAPTGLALRGDILYIGGSGGIVKADLSQTNPTVETVLSNNEFYTSLLFIGDFLYATNEEDSRVIRFNINDATPNIEVILDSSDGINGPDGLYLFNGELYIGVLFSQKIIKIDPNESDPTPEDVITGIGGVGLVLKDDEVFFSDFSQGRIFKFNINDDNPTPVEVVNGLSFPVGITLSGSFLYIAELNRISRIDINLDSPTPETVATGLGTSRYCAFNGVDLFIAEQSANKISKIEILPPLFPDLGSVCTGTNPTDLGGATPTGGVYSGMGVTDNGDGETFTFDPSVTGLGTQTITYTIEDTPASAVLEVINPPVVTFSTDNEIEFDAMSPPTGLGMVTPTGGTYSGIGIVDDGNGMTFSFDADAYMPGDYTVTYTYEVPNGNGCAVSANVSILVYLAGSALDFDGIDDEVLINLPTSSIDNDNFSISGWVYPTSEGITNSDFDGFFGWRDNTDADFYLLQLNDTQIEARFRNSAGQNFDIVGGNLELNTWQHYTFTYDGSQIVLYRNGEEVGSTAASGTIGATDNFFLGYLPFNNFNFHLDGRLDDVRVWGKTLNCYEVAQQYECELVGTEDDLLAYYQFNQGGTSTVLDATTGPNGTLSNFALSGDESNFVSDGGVDSGTTCSDVTSPMVSLSGMGNDIPSDNTPSTMDGTDLGSVEIGLTASSTFSFSNTGDAAITIESIESDNSTFTITAPTSETTVAAGSSIDVTVVFTPDAVQTENAVISINTTDCGIETITFNVQAEGLECVAPVINGVDFVSCINGVFTWQVNGELNGAAEWEWTFGTSTGQECTELQTADLSSNETLTTAYSTQGFINTYYVRAVGGCLDEPVCFAYIPGELAAIEFGITFTAPGPFSTTDGLQSLTQGMPMGGTYSGEGVVDNGDGSYSFDPSIGAGTYPVTYTGASEDGCSGAVTSEIIVEECIAPVINGVNIISCDGSNITLEVDGELNGADDWQWVAPPTFENFPCDEQVVLQEGGTQFVINNNAPNLTFYVRAVGGCLSEPVCFGYVMNDLLDVSFDVPGPFFTDSGIQALTGGMPEGGVYTGNGVINNGDGTYSFDPAIGAGSYTVTYTLTDANNCSSFVAGDIVVEECIAPVINGVSVVSCDGSNITLEVDIELNGADDWQWVAPPTFENFPCDEQVVLQEGGTQFVINNNAPDLTFYVRAIGGCLSEPVCFAYVMNDLLGVSFDPPSPVSINAGIQPLTSGMPEGGVYSGTGVIDNGDGTYSFDPAVGIGTYTITYTVTDADNCSSFVEGEIEVDNSTNVTNIQNTEINVFPNPTNGLVRIENILPQEVTILNNMGQVVSTQRPTDNNVNLTNLSAGVYILQIRTKEGIYSAKVVKK